MPSLNSLRAFEAAARHLSFRKAAVELHVTPAAISHQIKGLEEQLGIALFHRLPRGLALTDAGLTGLRSLRAGFAKLEQAVEQMRESGQSGSLALQVAPSFAAKWLLPRLPKFSAAHPDIDLSIVGSANQVDGYDHDAIIRDDFRGGDVQIEIRFGSGDYPGCHVDRIFGVSAVTLCSPALLDGENALKTPADLAHHTLLHDETPWDGRPDWETWLARAAVCDIDTTRGSHYAPIQLLLQAAMDGQGVALTMDVLAARDIALGRLVMPFEQQVPVEGAFYLVTLAETANLPHIAAFKHWLLAEADIFRRKFPREGGIQRPPAPANDGRAADGL
jgi:LysR family transcriptional regulator, glycine cleavage system transcriptional activator